MNGQYLQQPNDLISEQIMQMEDPWNFIAICIEAIGKIYE
jgi:hypothetical protein